MKKKPSEPILRLCKFCGKEIHGHFEYIKPRKGKEFCVCEKCVAELKRGNK